MKNLLFLGIRVTGLPALIREIVQRDKVTILLFHDINKETAEKSFSYLSKKYNIIGLNDFLDAYEKKDADILPKKSLIITFDDGHIRNYTLLSIIKKYNIPVTIFLCASIINTNRHFWFRYEDLLLSSSEVKQNVTQWYEDLANYGYQKDREFENPQALQKNQIEEMKPYINFQSHTLYHPILPRCRGSEAETEINKSKEILEKDYGLKINAISYPNGDYSERDIIFVKNAGYTCGITIDFGYNTLKTNLFRLNRLSVNDTNNMSELIVKASGLWAFVKTIIGKKHGYGMRNYE